MSEVTRTLREIGRLALAEGDVDLAWVVAFLGERDDLASGARFADRELDSLPAGENLRVGLRKLRERGIVEVWIEREGRPTMTWTVFLPVSGLGASAGPSQDMRPPE